MTRDEFDAWLDENKNDALDDVQQSDTTPKKWLGRLYAALYATLKAEDDEDDDEPLGPNDEDDEEEEAEEEEA